MIDLYKRTVENTLRQIGSDLEMIKTLLKKQNDRIEKLEERINRESKDVWQYIGDNAKENK